MTIKQNASKEFLGDKPSEKVVTGQGIIDGISTNPIIFTAPTYTVAQMQAANVLLLNSLNNARTGDHNNIANAHLAEKAWDNVFGKTANYVSYRAQGDINIITLGGFVPTKGESSPNTVPDNGQLQDLAVHGGGVTEVNMVSQGKGRVSAYMYLAIPDDAEVSFAADGTATITLSNGQKMYAKSDTHRSTTMGGMEKNVPLKLIAQPVNNAGAGQASTPKPFTPQA